MGEKNFWLHRISHNSQVSYPLLQNGYLSIGFSDFLAETDFLPLMLDEDNDSRWMVFEETNEKLWGGKYRTRHNLWRFLCDFKKGDWVIVPSWGTFSIYEIDGNPEYVGRVIKKGFCDWNKREVISCGYDSRFIGYDEEEKIDIGYVVKVKMIEEGIPRTDYAENSLLSRMKIRQTNAKINDLAKDIENALNRFRNKNPISIYRETVEKLSIQLDDIIKRIVDDRQFERLIKCYLEKIGADFVYIPAKTDGEGEADGDVVARFDSLKLYIFVQAKHHTGMTDSKSVKQIFKYVGQKTDEVSDPEYSSIAWVISSADDFTDEAKTEAMENNVRLINGIEFRKMLIDAGVSRMAIEFSL